jgi:hypothetical protein
MLRRSVIRFKHKKKIGKYKQYNIKFGGRDLVVQGYEPQALKYLTKELNFLPEQILCECESVPVIRYKYSGRFRDYFPDIYIPHMRLIIEVKSEATLGILNNKQRGWSMNCAKAKACRKAGFKFMLLCLDARGNRTLMPKNWPSLTKADCVEAINKLNPTRGKVAKGLFQL